MRSYHLAKKLAEKGILVRVVYGHNPDGPKIESTDRGIEYFPIEVPYSQEFGVSERIHSFLSFSIKACNKKYRKGFDADLSYVISTPLSLGMTALYLKLFAKIPYVFEVGDLWPEVPIQMGILKNPVTIQLSKWLEKKTYRSSLALSSLSPAITNHIKKLHPKADIIETPNFSDFRPGKSEKEKGSNFRIGYFGSIGLANGVDFIVDIVNSFDQDEELAHFFFMVSGSQEGKIKKALEKRNDVTFNAYSSKSETKELMQSMDAGLVSFSNYPILGTGSPNKLFDLLALGVIPIVNTKSWYQEMLENSNSGIYIPYESLNLLKGWIRKLKENSELKETMKKNALELSLKKFPMNEMLENWSQRILNPEALKD